MELGFVLSTAIKVSYFLIETTTEVKAYKTDD